MHPHRILVALTVAAGVALLSVTIALARTPPDRPFEGGSYDELSWRGSSGFRGDETGGYWLDFDPRASVADLRRGCRDANPLAIVPVAAAPDTAGNTTRLLARCPTPTDTEK